MTLSIRIPTAILSLGLAAAAAGTDGVPLLIDRDRVTTGSHAYQVVNNDEIDGRIEVDLRFTKDAFVLHDHSASAGLGLEEDLLIRMDPHTFAPRAIDLTGDFNGTHVSGRFRFADDHVDGNVQVHRPADGNSQDRVVSVDLAPGTLTRGAALYLANAMPGPTPGEPLVFSWFSPLEGQIAEITYSHEGTTTVTVPAGIFECDIVRQAGGQPGNLIYIARDDGRIVRFDVVGQPVRLELLGNQ